MRVRSRHVLAVFGLLVLAAFLTAIGYGIWLYAKYNYVHKDPPKSVLQNGGRVGHFQFSPDGRHFIATCGRTLRVWDRATWQVVWTDERSLLDPVSHLAYSPDGKKLAVSCTDGRLELKDADRGKQLLVLQRGGIGSKPDGGEEDKIDAIAFSPDGQTLAVAIVQRSEPKSTSGAIRLWDLENGKEKRVIKGIAPAITSLVYSSDGTTIITGHQDGAVKTWDSVTGTHRRDLPENPRAIKATAFSPKAKVMAFSGSWTSAHHVATLRDLDGGKELRRAGIPEEQNYATSVSCISFSADGRTLATGEMIKDLKHPYYRVRFWNVSTGLMIGFRWCPQPVLKICLSPDGTEVAVVCEGSGSDAGDILIWDVISRASPD